MVHHSRLLILSVAVLCCSVSCSHISGRMPQETEKWHKFLTKHDADECRNYHYNFERQAPRLYAENQPDSLLDAIEYIKTECGPASNLELFRTLLLSDVGRYDDSLVGSSTMPQMVWYRAEQEYRPTFGQWNFLYGFSRPIDNTHDRFEDLTNQLARQISQDSEAVPQAQALGLFYSGNYDTAMAMIQSDRCRGTALRAAYDDYVGQLKSMFPGRFNFGLLVGVWVPQNNISFLGEHPDFGVQLGGESRRWRGDLVFNVRFTDAANDYQVHDGSSVVTTDKFTDWLLGAEFGYKVFESAQASTDVFIGLGFEQIVSVEEPADPRMHVTHGSFAPSIGLRHRIFLNNHNGWYIGGNLRYSYVDHSNPRGTDLSGGAMTISFITGWSLHATLQQFLKAVNYKGSWRQ